MVSGVICRTDLTLWAKWDYFLLLIPYLVIHFLLLGQRLLLLIQPHRLTFKSHIYGSDPRQEPAESADRRIHFPQWNCHDTCLFLPELLFFMFDVCIQVK